MACVSGRDERDRHRRAECSGARLRPGASTAGRISPGMGRCAGDQRMAGLEHDVIASERTVVDNVAISGTGRKRGEASAASAASSLGSERRLQSSSEVLEML